MKRARSLFERIGTGENLRRAFLRARRGKQGHPDVLAFERDLEGRLRRLGEQLRAGSVEVGRAHTFEIHDPKRRLITAPAFEERVLHHAIMNVCLPAFERYCIFDTYACRDGKGAHAAVARAQVFARRAPFVLKLDVARYYPSIDHGRLLALLARRFGEPRLLRLFARIIRAFETTPGRGLPIGSLMTPRPILIPPQKPQEQLRGVRGCV